MAELQIKISIGNADIHLQGDGELVYKIFSDITTNGMGELNTLATYEKSNDTEQQIDNCYEISTSSDNSLSSSPSIKSKARRRNTQSTPQLIKDLDLNGTSEKAKSLKEFINEKKPKSNVQITTVFVYYLQNMLGIEDITIDHIFTCYKGVGLRVPTNLMQNLTDTSSSRYGYINRKDGKYSINVIGSNFVEYDLPKGE